MSTEFSQNHICRLLLASLFALICLVGWSCAADADPLRRLDQIKAALAAPKAPDMRAFAGQAPERRGLLHRPPARAFPPGPPLAMPSFSTAYVRDGLSFPLTVIGTDPARGLTTTIPTVIFAYRLQLADGSVFDASSDVIDGVTPVQGVRASPIFTPAPWTIGGVSLITQWSDTIMRANFAGSMKDGYHVLLGAPTVIPITVNVPAAFGFSFTDPKSGVLIAAIDADWMLNLNIQVTQSQAIPPTTLPIHLFSQVIARAFQGELFGFHFFYGFTTSSGATVAAPFIQAAYLSKALVDPNGISQAENTGVLAHEVAEWLMDPTVTNFTMPWQDPAQPGVCSNPAVEVGDPLEAISPGLVIGGYRFPDLALLPWFTGSQVLRSINQQYSLFGGLTSRSSVCPDFQQFGQTAFGVAGAATFFSGINNRHQVVGFFTVGNALGSFILSNVDPIAGTPVTASPVFVPSSLVTIAQGVNDAGNVVGIYVDASQGQERGFLLQGSVYIPIDFPGAVATEALGTNKHGDIVGNYTDVAGRVHGFALMNGRFLEVDAPFATSGLSVSAINDSRMVVGTYSSGSTIASFSGPLGNLQPFGFPQVSPLDLATFPVTFTTFANGLNNSQEIVGGVAIPAFPPLAYVAKAGLFKGLGSDLASMAYKRRS